MFEGWTFTNKSYKSSQHSKSSSKKLSILANVHSSEEILYHIYMWERIPRYLIISAVLRRILNDYCSLFCKSVLFHPQFDESLLNNLPKIFDISTWALTCIPWTLTLRTRTTVYFTPLCNHQYFCCWCCRSILPVCCWLICNSKLFSLLQTKSDVRSAASRKSWRYYWTYPLHSICFVWRGYQFAIQQFSCLPTPHEK